MRPCDSADCRTEITYSHFKIWPYGTTSTSTSLGGSHNTKILHTDCQGWGSCRNTVSGISSRQNWRGDWRGQRSGRPTGGPERYYFAKKVRFPPYCCIHAHTYKHKEKYTRTHTNTHTKKYTQTHTHTYTNHSVFSWGVTYSLMYIDIKKMYQLVSCFICHDLWYAWIHAYYLIGHLIRVIAISFALPSPPSYTPYLHMYALSAHVMWYKL